MIVTLFLLLALAVSVATLPRRERAAGIVAALAALTTAGILAASEGGFALAPHRWLFGVALTLAALNYLLGAIEPGPDKHERRLR